KKNMKVKRKAITCKEDDKNCFDAICFIKKMKQHELISEMIKTEVEKMDSHQIKIFNAMKNRM
ncbi:hypothetical protein EC562_24300, partial [Vibrio parahaemolyticus]|nr:hypothetical protein [Vibrio parahaemolyticus]